MKEDETAIKQCSHDKNKFYEDYLLQEIMN